MVHGDVEGAGGAVIEESPASTTIVSRGILMHVEGLR